MFHTKVVVFFRFKNCFLRLLKLKPTLAFRQRLKLQHQKQKQGDNKNNRKCKLIMATNRTLTVT